MLDAVAIGELLIDFTPAPVPEESKPHFALNPGGAPANVMVAMQKLGGKTGFIGKVGEDSFGVFLKATLDKEGVVTEGLMQDSAVPTTLAFVTLDDCGDRSFMFYRNPGADIMLTEQEVRQDIIEQAGILHFGSVSLTDLPSREATIFAVNKARELGKIVSYDPNYRPMLWKSEELALQNMKWGLLHADIVKVSQEEMELLTGETDIIKGSKALVELGVCIVLVSAGAEGAYYATDDFVGHVPTYCVKAMDTNGAGDSFFGAMLYQLRGKTKKDLQGISQEVLETYVSFANAAGSITTTRSGAIPAMPSLEEVETCVKTQEKLVF